jgi:hypothetical protein
MRAAVKFGVVDCIADCAWLAVTQATEWQRIGDQIDASEQPASAQILENFIAQIPDLVKWEDIESEILECNLERLRNSKTPFERRMVANRSTSNPFL